MLELKKAYSKLHADQELLRFQAIRYKDGLFVMTRMSFGLNVAPKIRTKVLSGVVSLDSEFDSETNHYIGDIIVNLDRVSVSRVREHLTKCGLITKEPECISGGWILDSEL